MIKLILDIGCGATPRGEINIDPFPFDRKQCWKKRDPKTIPKFIFADAEALPFRDKIFDTALCIHTLEHLKYPLKALKEMNRTVKKKIIIKVPSQFNINKTETHLYTWNPETLKNLLNTTFKNVQTDYASKINFLNKNYIIIKFLPFLNSFLPKIGLYPEICANIIL